MEKKCEEQCTGWPSGAIALLERHCNWHVRPPPQGPCPAGCCSCRLSLFPFRCWPSVKGWRRRRGGDGMGGPHANTRIARSGCHAGAQFQVPGVSGPAGDHDRGGSWHSWVKSRWAGRTPGVQQAGCPGSDGPGGQRPSLGAGAEGALPVGEGRAVALLCCKQKRPRQMAGAL